MRAVDDANERLAGRVGKSDCVLDTLLDRYPYLLEEQAFDASYKTMDSRPKWAGYSVVVIKSGGGILTLEQLSIVAGIRQALVTAFMDYQAAPVFDSLTGKFKTPRKITQSKALKYSLCPQTRV